MITKAILAGAGTLALAGAAIAADKAHHILNVTLPDGSVEQIHYSGDVAPHVVMVPAVPLAWTPIGFYDADAIAPFAMLYRITAAMDQHVDLMMHQAATMAAHSSNDGATPDLVSARNMPAGTMRYSFVSTSSGDGTCSRSVQITSLGSDQAPKVVRQASGDCAVGARPGQTTPAVQARSPDSPRVIKTRATGDAVSAAPRVRETT